MDGLNSDRIAAWGAVVAVHVALLLWMLRTDTPPTHQEARALQVHWVERAKQTTHRQPQVAPVSVQQPQAPIVAPASKPVQAVAEVASTPADPADRQGRPLSAVFLEQGRRWAAEQAPAVDFQRAPFAARENLVGSTQAGHFRMRETMTVAKVARGIGTLFAGPGYTTDPCPRIRANMANLNTGGDRALVDEEVRRLRRLCQ